MGHYDTDTCVSALLENIPVQTYHSVLFSGKGGMQNLPTRYKLFPSPSLLATHAHTKEKGMLRQG